MIKINLLDSVTERSRSVAAVEAQVANPRARTWMLGAVVAGMLVFGIGVDWYSANSALAKSKLDLEREEAIAARMAAINKEQADLENKIKAIQVRIDAIKRLRAAQQGPVAVLSAINERLPGVNEFRLEGIEQKGGDLIIEGHSPNEAAVTQFGRSLEFSDGLFSNVSISTERKEIDVKNTDLKAGETVDPDAPKPETVHFTVKCKYTVPGGAAPTSAQPNNANPAATNAPAKNQVAKV